MITAVNEKSHPASQIVAVMTEIYRQKLTSTSGGNLSIRDGKGNMWITPGSIDKETLCEEDIICVTPDGKIHGIHKPSIEYRFHLKIYEKRPEIKAVVHAHPPALVAFSMARKLPQTKLFYGAAKTCGVVGMADYAVPGSNALVAHVEKAFANGCDCVVMANHGAVVGSTDSLFDAYRKFTALEICARIERNATFWGNTCLLDDAQISRLDDIWKVPGKLSGVLEKGCGINHESNEKTEKKSGESIGFIFGVECDWAERKELVKWVKRAFAQKLFHGSLFSVSIRLAEESYLITPEGCLPSLFDEMQAVKMRGGSCEPGKCPDFLWSVHESIYRRHPEVNSVILNTPEHMMALAVTDGTIDTRTMPEIYLMLREFPHISMVEYAENPEKLAGLLTSSTPTAYLENGFLVTTGDNLQTAFDRMEVAEYAAESTECCRNLGDIIPIGEEEVQIIRDMFHLT